MTTRVEATFTNGVLKPDQPLPLPDQTRVRLTVEPIEEWSPEKARAAWEALQARLKERPINSGGLRFTRDELHERR
jgi:predicted DNA-binding antitoxin AbrB/MazE fold protein